MAYSHSRVARFYPLTPDLSDVALFPRRSAATIPNGFTQLSNMSLHVNQSQHRHNLAIRVTSRIVAPETMRISSIAVLHHPLPCVNVSRRLPQRASIAPDTVLSEFLALTRAQGEVRRVFEPAQLVSKNQVIRWRRVMITPCLLVVDRDWSGDAPCFSEGLSWVRFGGTCFPWSPGSLQPHQDCFEKTIEFSRRAFPP
jgi:hypothetical protein